MIWNLWDDDDNDNNSDDDDGIGGDDVMYFCQINEPSQTVGSPAEILSRRCVTLLRAALKQEAVWPNAELKLSWFEKILMTVESHQPNFTNICTALDLLTFLLNILVS